MYYLSFILIAQLYFSKIAYLYFEKSFNLAQVIELLLLTLLVVYSFRRKLSLTKGNFQGGISIKHFLIVLIISLPMMSIIVEKKTLAWDAIALYDARAKFLAAGMSFKDMSQITLDDIPANQNYYLMYPPFTSMVHYFWESTSNNPLLVTYYYGLLYILFIIASYLLLRENAPKTAIFGTLLVAFNADIYRIATIEYPNLPFSLAIVVAAYEAMEYLKSKRPESIFRACLLLSLSMWTRFIEPIWLLMLVSVVATLALVDRKNLTKHIFPISTVVITSGISYYCWSNFLAKYGASANILSHSEVNIYRLMIEGLFNGKLVDMLRKILSTWTMLFPVLFNLIASALIIIKDGKKIAKQPELVFLLLFTFLSAGLYLAGTYVASVSTDWWIAAVDSVKRSSTFLIPINLCLGVLLFSKTINLKYLPKT